MGDGEGGADFFVETPDEVSGEGGGFLFIVLMDEEVEFLQAGFFPFGDFFDPLIESRAVGFRLIGTDPANEGGGGGESHVHEVATAGGVDEDIGDAVGFEEVVKFSGDFGVVVPVSVSELHGEGDLIGPVFGELFDAVEIFRSEVVVDLEEGHFEFFAEVRHVGDVVFDDVGDVFEASAMRNGLFEFGEEAEAGGDRGVPLVEGGGGEEAVEGGVQFDAVELSGVVGEFVLDPFRVEIFEVLFVPLGAADIDGEVFGFWGLGFEEFGRGRVVGGDVEVHVLRIVGLSEFHFVFLEGRRCERLEYKRIRGVAGRN